MAFFFFFDLARAVKSGVYAYAVRAMRKQCCRCWSHKWRLCVRMKTRKCQVKSSHIYLYSAFHNTDCIKAASQ